MTQYYIEVPDSLVEKSNLNAARYELGQESFSTFYPSAGYFLLEHAAEAYPEFLPYFEIRDDQGESYEISEFLDTLEGFDHVLR